MSKAADSSSKISIEDLESALARASTTESKAVSVECPILTPVWLLSRRLFCVRIYIYTVGTESIQTPLNFSLFVILQPFAKII